MSHITCNPCNCYFICVSRIRINCIISTCINLGCLNEAKKKTHFSIKFFAQNVHVTRRTHINVTEDHVTELTPFVCAVWPLWMLLLFPLCASAVWDSSCDPNDVNDNAAAARRWTRNSETMCPVCIYACGSVAVSI